MTDYKRDQGSLLSSLELFCQEKNIPTLKKESAALLELLVRIKQPKSILEVGTAIGLSAIRMALASPSSHLTTIEHDAERVSMARDNIQAFGLDDRIRVLYGDAGEVLQVNRASYDFVFLDAAKGHYVSYFDAIADQVEPGGIVMADNVLFRGMVEGEGIAVRRKVTIIKRLRTYLEYVESLPNWQTTLLSFDDGLAISIKEQV